MTRRPLPSAQPSRVACLFDERDHLRAFSSTALRCRPGDLITVTVDRARTGASASRIAMAETPHGLELVKVSGTRTGKWVASLAVRDQRFHGRLTVTDCQQVKLQLSFLCALVPAQTPDAAERVREQGRQRGDVTPAGGDQPTPLSRPGGGAHTAKQPDSDVAIAAVSQAPESPELVCDQLGEITLDPVSEQRLIELIARVDLCRRELDLSVSELLGVLREEVDMFLDANPGAHEPHVVAAVAEFFSVNVDSLL